MSTCVLLEQRHATVGAQTSVPRNGEKRVQVFGGSGERTEGVEND